MVQALVNVDLTVVSFPSGIAFAFVLRDSIDAEAVHAWIRVALVLVYFTSCSVVAVRTEAPVAVDQIGADSVV